MYQPPYLLHRLAKQGDLQPFLDAAEHYGDGLCEALDARDRCEYTPLMCAVSSLRADAAFVRAVLQLEQRVFASPSSRLNREVMALAVRSANVDKVVAMLEAGGDLHYMHEAGYDAVLDACFGRDVVADANLNVMLAFLISRKASLNTISSYGESAARVLSRVGRFDAVQFLLESGTDPGMLGWSALSRAVALGTIDDVQQAIATGDGLEDRDFWERTPWLIALLTGDLSKAKLLQEAGADVHARGRCGRPPFFYAIDSRSGEMLQWLIATGQNVEQRDEFGTTPLIHAVEESNSDAVDILLQAGACVDAKKDDCTALRSAFSRDVASRLLAAGADPSQLTGEGQRALLGFVPDAELDVLAEISRDDFVTERARVFGRSNPEAMNKPFWNAMVRAGVTGYEATTWFAGPSSLHAGPVWCARRFGQSITFLPDGRIVQIAGEHEDSYDPDFCIYNDVFVHGVDGSLQIYGYPESAFPPTDFHTATLIGDWIYVIGSLGYGGTPRYGETPVYRLNTRSFKIEQVISSGDPPGWILEHRADLIGPGKIRVTGGKLLTTVAGSEKRSTNSASRVFDTSAKRWSIGS
jgi:ankyrin repeat protein